MQKLALLCLLASCAHAQLINLSSRLDIGIGSSETSLTFTLDTDTTVLLRAIGPTLSNFGVVGTLSDPTLQLYSGSTLIGSNDDWEDAQASELSSAFSSVGAFALGSGSADAALLVTLSAGTYTAQISGVGGASGTGLTEFYQVGSTNPVSQLVLQGYHNGTTNTGYVLTSAVDLLVRALGASTFVGGVADPTINVLGFSGSGFTPIGANTDWGISDDASLITGYSSALSLPTLGDQDAAVLLSSAPTGPSTIALSGSTGLFQIDISDLTGVVPGSPVPEPSTVALITGAAVGALAWRRRHRSRTAV